MSKKIYIGNCKYSFEYKCPLEWKNLKRTEDSNIRFCNECSKNVYHCKTEKDIDKHIKSNHCIALDEPTHTMGVISPPEDWKNF